MFSKLWNDEAGFVTLEYLLGATILVLGMIVGLSSLRRAITSELSELAGAIGTLSQNYSFAGLAACGSAVDGSSATGDLPGLNTFTAIAPGNGVSAIDNVVCP